MMLSGAIENLPKYDESIRTIGTRIVMADIKPQTKNVLIFFSRISMSRAMGTPINTANGQPRKQRIF
jgi:hypothetical protein